MTVTDLPLVIVSYSELDTFRQCPLKHHLAYGRRWTKPPKADSALAKGSLWHLVMETHYKTILEFDYKNQEGGNHTDAEIMEVIVQRIYPFLHDEDGNQNTVQELIEWMYYGHVEMWGLDRDWKILAIEHQIIQPLPDRKGKPSRYHLKAKIDLLIFDLTTQGLWVVDHKSGANLPTQMDLEIDDQFGLYTWAMRAVGRKVQGSLHSANRTQRNKGPMALDTRLSRTYLNRSDVEVSNLALDAYEAARAAYPDDPANAPRYSSPDPRSCGWKCDFKEPHLLMRKGRKPDEVLVEYGFRINTTRH